MKWMAHDPSTAGAIWGLGNDATEAFRDAKHHMCQEDVELEVCRCDDEVYKWVEEFGGEECPYYIGDGKIAHLTALSSEVRKEFLKNA